MAETTQKQRDWILATKLNPPLIRSDIVDRPHLLARLERDVRRPLTLISAPAGYGKSTLAAQWLAASGLPGAWISLDEADNNPRTFLGYVVAAVRSLEPQACARLHALLDAAQLPPSDILARLLANDLEGLSEPFLLVLDDYHLITDPAIHDLLDRLLQHPPRSLHLVIATRRDPPLPLITLKARGLAVEIREADLQFDPTETGQVLEQIGGIHLDAHGLARVMDEIEGWITGLRLFCLAVDGREDPNAYLFGMSDGAIHVQDYLVEQVLSRQPPELQDCLLRTSILDRFCAPLCDLICSAPAGKRPGTEKGRVSGRKFMESVAEAKLFGVQLDPRGEWVRYHHLFQELLRSHLRRKSDPQTVAELHRRAAQWFDGKGLIEEGLKHALAAGDSELAARMIEGVRMTMINTDQWARLRTWLDSLPPGVEDSHPHLLMSRAYLLLHSLRRVAEIPVLLDKVVALEGESPADPMLAGELNLFRGIPELRMGEFEASKRHFRAALRRLPETNEEGRSLSQLYCHVIAHMEGHRELALEGLRAAIQREGPRSLHYKTRLVFGLIYVNALAGHWPESFRAAEHLVRFSQPNNLSFAVAWGESMQGSASLHMFDLEEADRCFAKAFERRYITNPQAAVDCLVAHALCRQLQGRESAADECMREAREFAYWTGDPVRVDSVDSGRARLSLLRGDQDFADRWLATYHGKPDLPVKMFFLEYPEITACRALVAKGTPESLAQAAARLHLLEEESRRFHHHCQLVPLLVIKSMLAFKENRLQYAQGVLTEAVSLAWPGRWILPFIEGGAPVAELLAQLPENPEWGEFVPRTLAHFDPDHNRKVAQQPEQVAEDALIVDLTNREIDVLVLLCERLYDKEMAERLAISPATVKTHLSRIYGKLGVSNRREAAREAKRLGLV